MNPARAKLRRPEPALLEYRWSRWPDYLRWPGKRPAWLRVDRLLGELGIPRDGAAGRREWERVLEARRGVEADVSYASIRRGWTEATLGERVKGDREKGKLAVRLRTETLVPVGWIAERWQRGGVANVNTLLYYWRQGRK